MAIKSAKKTTTRRKVSKKTLKVEKLTFILALTIQ